MFDGHTVVHNIWGILSIWAFSLVCDFNSVVLMFALWLAVMVLAWLQCDLLHMAAWESHLSQLNAACLSSSGGMFWAALAACVFRLALFTPQRTMYKGRDSDPQSFICRKLDIKPYYGCWAKLLEYEYVAINHKLVLYVRNNRSHIIFVTLKFSTCHPRAVLRNTNECRPGIKQNGNSSFFSPIFSSFVSSFFSV